MWGLWRENGCFPLTRFDQIYWNNKNNVGTKPNANVNLFPLSFLVSSLHQHVGKVRFPSTMWALVIFSHFICKCLQCLGIAHLAQNTTGKCTRLIIKDPENCEQHLVVLQEILVMLFMSYKPLVSNISHLMCRCAGVWNMLSFYGKDSTLFLPIEMRKCLARFSTIV